MTIAQFFIIQAGALITAAGGIFLKRLSDGLNHQATAIELCLHIVRSPNFWLGGLCYLSPVLLWIYLLKYMELTKLQPQLSIVYIYTIILSLMFLNETPTPARLAGIAFIVVGVVIVGRT